VVSEDGVPAVESVVSEEESVVLEEVVPAPAPPVDPVSVPDPLGAPTVTVCPDEPVVVVVVVVPLLVVVVVVPLVVVVTGQDTDLA
jgi:hypothetical protein